jgi:uncharacterized membrane protein
MNIKLYTQIVSLVLCTVVLIGSVGIAGYDLITDHKIPFIIVSVLSAGLAYALHQLGISQGVNLQPMNTAQGTTSELPVVK